jgi:hypothetical protein
MKKQELIHLHGLLAEVSTHCELNADLTLELEEYHSLGVRPTSIHKSKTDHKGAVFSLAEGITSSLAQAEPETLATRAD